MHDSPPACETKTAPAAPIAAEQVTLRVVHGVKWWYDLPKFPRDRIGLLGYAVFIIVAGMLLLFVVAVVGPVGASGWAKVSLAWIVGILVFRYLFRRVRKVWEVEMNPVAWDPRLKAFGKEKELRPLAELPDVPFEPMIAQNIGSGVGPAILFLGYGLFHVLKPLLKRSSSNYWATTGLCAGFVCVMLAMLTKLWCYIFPTYYRVVPGRLDVLKGSPFARTPWLHDRYDLRVARVIARFDQNTLYLYSPGQRSLEISLGTISEPEEFVKTVFQAAVCTHTAPPLPDDALLG